MRIEAFALAWNIKINNYPYALAILSLTPFVDRLVINYLKSEDNTLHLIKRLKSDLKHQLIIDIVQQPEDEYLHLLKAGEGNKFLNITKNYARSKCHDGFVWLLDLDEQLNSKQFKHLKDIVDKVNADAYWFPFLHYWGDNHHIVEGKYYSAACRLFRNFPVLGDGWTGFAPGYHTFLPSFFIEHYGLKIKERWKHKQRLYPNSDMSKDAVTHDGYIYKIKKPIPLKDYCRPLNLDKVILENRDYSNIEIMKLPIFEKMLFCGLLANEGIIIGPKEPESKFEINQMRLAE